MIELGITAVLLVLGYVFGSINEKEHFQKIRIREHRLKAFPTHAGTKTFILNGEVKIVCGSVVVASDYFKSFIGNLKSLFGGRLTSYESLMDRARREAIIRMKESAVSWGAQEVIDVQINTSFIDKLGVEVSAVGTAIKRQPV